MRLASAALVALPLAVIVYLCLIAAWNAIFDPPMGG